MTGDEARRRAGYLTAAELVEALPEVLVLDPAGTMVAPNVSVAPGAVLYPGVVLHAAAGGRIELGASRLWPGTRLLADAGGTITVGDGCVFEGGVTVRAAGPAAAVRVGARCRLSNGAELLADAELGDGAQIHRRQRDVHRDRPPTRRHRERQPGGADSRYADALRWDLDGTELSGTRDAGAYQYR